VAAVRARGVCCLWWIPAQKDAKKTAFWHPTAAASDNLIADLYPASEMPAF
jgi:hypothetical protein